MFTNYKLLIFLNYYLKLFKKKSLKSCQSDLHSIIIVFTEILGMVFVP